MGVKNRMTRLMRNQRDSLAKYRVYDNRKQNWVMNDGVGEVNEHFTIMLKDAYSRAALMAYAEAAATAGDKEYAKDVMDLANRAGELHPNCKTPD
jgi:hypothetical protein